jgi:serine/threonine-protein kinase RsbW
VLNCQSVSGDQTIRLEVPGVITFRDVVLRTTSAASKLVSIGTRESEQTFSAHIVSAVGEAFNNIALHGYSGRQPDIVRMTIDIGRGFLRVTLEDFGHSFDPNDATQPDLDSLPESGLGVFIMKSFMDEISYTNGRPNVLTLLKRIEPVKESSVTGKPQR